MFKGRAPTLTRFRTLMLTTAVLAGCGGGEDIATETIITDIDTTTPAETWQLVWSDEFDSNSLDMNKWSFEINCDGGGNSEEQCYTDSPENLFIDGGILNIVARPTASDSALTKPYTSSRIVTQNKADWTYGRIEVRAKSPKGQGSWAAAWLMPTDSVYGTWPLSGEIDLVEWVNIGEVRADGEVDRHAHGTLHYGPMQGSSHDFTGTEYALPNASPADDFHVYAVEWEEGEIRWYVDDELFAYQRDSEVTYRPKDGQAAGLSEQGWYTEILNADGEEEVVYKKSPYDQDFFVILNNAVGGNWAGRTHQAANYTVGDDKGTIAQGVDHSAYVDGNAFQVDYVRVYQCEKDPVTGKGCATISSDYYNDTFVKGAAPVPIPDVIPVPVGVDIFTDENSAWDIVGEDEAEEIDSGDEEYGEVVQFTVTNDSEELGFAGPSYDGTLLPDEAKFEFDIKVLSNPTDETASWLFKVEYELPEVEVAQRSNSSIASDSNAEMGSIELMLDASEEGVLPTPGEWQHYSFNFGALRELGLESENIVSIKIFPTVGQGAGAVYQVDNVTIGDAYDAAELLLFADEENLNWPMWDDQVTKGVSSVVPVVVMDEDPEYGNTAQFHIAGNSVVGFSVRQDHGGSGYPFDASSLAFSGAIEFDIKVIDPPANANAPWFLKLESNGGTALGGTAVDYRLPEAPVIGEWTNYSISMESLMLDGLDISAIDIALIFPQWGQGNGATFRVDNMIMHATTVEDDTSSDVKGPDNTVYQELITLYDDSVRNGWTLWDCCAALPQVEVMDDEEHNYAVEFTIGEGSDGGSVVGFWGRNSGETLDLSPITSNGVLRFDLKVMTMPEDETTNWLIKIESSNATGNTFAELSLTDSKQGVAPRLDEWQSYSFPLIDLASAGLNLTEVDLLMMFPEWAKGLGAVYRVDNVYIGIPEGDEDPYNGTGNDGGSGGGSGGGDNGGDDGSQEPGVELLTNSDFSSSEGWGGTDGMADSIVNGVFTADVAVAGNPWDVSLKQNMLLMTDATYQLTFDARSDDARSIIAGLGLDEDPWTNVTETVALTTEWTTYTFTMTIAGFGSSNSRVFFDMGAETGQVQLDNVSVVLIDAGSGGGDDGSGGSEGELLTNSGFDSAEAWGGTDGMADSIANGIFSADIAVAGNPWDVSLKQNLTLVADTDYVLTFDARSDDARSIIAGLGLDQDPWTNVTETVGLSTEWTTYTVNLTTTGFGGEGNRVFFDMGAEAGQVQLDNVSLVLASGDSGGDNGDTSIITTIAPATLFADEVLENWASWDCCADSTPTLVEDDADHGTVVEFAVNGDTVLGFMGRDNGGALDASGVSTLSFDMKVTSLPTQTDAPWLLKLESGEAGKFVEVNLSTSAEGALPSDGQWQTYTFSIAELEALGTNFDTSNIDVVMVFPAWGQGVGAVYRIDNVVFSGSNNGGGDNGGDDGGDNGSGGTGEELLTNTGFDSAEAWGGTDGMAESIVDGIFSANVAVAGNPWDVSLKQNVSLIADTDYILTFDARSDDARSIIAGLGLDQDPWTNVTETVSLTTEWTTYTLNLTTTGFGGEGNRVFFDMGAEAGQVQLDNVSLVLVTADNGGDDGGDDGSGGSGEELLTNSSFDSSEGWGGTDGMAESIVDGVFTADVAVAGNAWDVSLKQNLTLIADTDYILTFDGRSDDARSIIAGLGLDQDPWTNVTETVNLTTEWTTYTLNLTTTGFGGEGNRLFFDLGAEAGQVQLDNVSLVLASAGDTGGDDGSDEPSSVATLDFETEGNAYTWTTFENDSNPALEVVANPAVDNVNDSTHVAKITALAAGQAWAGVESAHGDFGPLTLDATNSTIKVMVYKSVISDVGIKFAIANGGAQPEIKVANTLVNQWEELTFDFSGNIGLAESIDIDQIIIFPDFNLDGRGQDNVVYVDNISFYGTSGGDNGGDDGGDDGSGGAGDELLTNTGFDSSEGWGGTDGMAESIVDGVFTADVAVAGNPWDVSLKQNLTLIADTDYVLTFDARSDDSRSVIAGLGLDQDPWTNATETVSLSTDWTTYTVNLTTTGFGGESNRVFFDLGAEAGQVQLDNVSLKISTGDDGGSVEPSDIATLDFETVGNGYTWSTFENDSNPALEVVANPAVDNVNDSTNVAKITALAAGQPWAGVESAHGDFGPLTLDATNSIVKVMVYKSVISDVGIKFAIANGGAQPEIKVANTLVNQWEELTFDFSGNIGLTESINIDQIIIFPDFNLDGRGQDNVVYVDNISFE